MPARVVVVHDEQEFIDQAVMALRLAGYEVAAFTDPMAALDALGAAQNVELLVTRVLFAPGKLHGVSLGRMARNKRPGVRVLFTALPEFAEHTKGVGEFMALPIQMPNLVEAVDRMLQSSS